MPARRFPFTIAAMARSYDFDADAMRAWLRRKGKPLGWYLRADVKDDVSAFKCDQRHT